MKVIIDETTYSGSPVEIVNELRKLLFNRPDVTDAEGYIHYIQDTYKRVFEQNMALPDAGLDGRIRAMFAILEDAGLAEVIEYA